MTVKERLPPSRRGKKQVVAHLDPAIVDAVHARRYANGLTIQEIVATAINAAVESYGRPPILKGGRERLVKRKKSLAQVQENNAPACRTGKKRLAAWFDQKDVDRLLSFANEFGLRMDEIVTLGLVHTIPGLEIPADR